MAKVETQESIAERKPINVGDFDDLWALIEAEIEKGMKTLDLGAIGDEVAQWRGR